MDNLCGLSGHLCSSCAKDKRIAELEAQLARVAEQPKIPYMSMKPNDKNPDVEFVMVRLDRIIEHDKELQAILEDKT